MNNKPLNVYVIGAMASRREGAYHWYATEWLGNGKTFLPMAYSYVGAVKAVSKDSAIINFRNHFKNDNNGKRGDNK